MTAAELMRQTLVAIAGPCLGILVALLFAAVALCCWRQPKQAER